MSVGLVIFALVAAFFVAVVFVSQREQRKQLASALDPACILCDQPIEDDVPCAFCGFDAAIAVGKPLDRYIELKSAQSEYEALLKRLSAPDVGAIAQEDPRTISYELHQYEMAAIGFLAEFPEIVDQLPTLNLSGFQASDIHPMIGGGAVARDVELIRDIVALIESEKRRLATFILQKQRDTTGA